MRPKDIVILVICLILGGVAIEASPYALFVSPPLGSDSLTAKYPFALVYYDPITRQNVTFGNEFVNLTGIGGVAALSSLTMDVLVIVNSSDIQPTGMYFEPSNAYQLENGALVASSFGPPKFANISLTQYATGVSRTTPPRTYTYWKGSTTLQYQTDGTYGGALVITKFTGVDLKAPIVAYMPSNSIHVSSEEEGVVARQNELTTSLTIVIVILAIIELRDKSSKTR